MMGKIKLSFISVLVIIIILIAFRVIWLNEAEKSEIKNNSVGIYILDLSKSSLGAYIKDSSSLNSLTLKLNQDMSFLFSRTTNFLFDSCGTWETVEDNIYSYNKIVYESNKEITDQISYCCYEGDKIEMKLPVSKKGFDQVNLLVFRKLE